MSSVNWYVFIYITLYFTTGFIYRSYIVYKQTGITPVTFGQNTESAHDYIGKWFKFTIALMFLHAFIHPFWPLPGFELLHYAPLKMAGFLLTISAFFYLHWAQAIMGHSWRIGIDEENPTSLVTSGPFRFSRNPIFLSMIATSVGLFLLTPTYWMAFLAISGYVLINIQIRLEEQHLLALHGEVYQTFKDQVPRFITFF